MSQTSNLPSQKPFSTLDDYRQRYLQCASEAQQQQAQAREAQTRARVLRDYDILDTPPEEAFDKITRLATQTFQVPIALITFIDAKRQWFKSHHGTDLHETDLSASFCLCAVQKGYTLVVPNALEDSRFFNNPSVTGGLNLRYYVGAPLITPEGVALGSLCLIDTVPRPRPSAEEISMLETLASMVVDEMRLRRSLHEQQQTKLRLQKLLQEKSILLKETHHRVKNNLQLVSSMLNIHSRKLTDATAKAALGESRERIAAIANVHELMYANQMRHHQFTQDHDVTSDTAKGTTNADNTQADSTQADNTQANSVYANTTGDILPEDRVDLAPLLTDLANNVMRLASQPVQLELNLMPASLNIHQAVPLSLIINELLTNTLKYAFPDASNHAHTPTINIQANVVQADMQNPRLHLTVSDNGVGLPADADISQASSLGFTIIQTLSEQLGAKLSWHDQNPSGLAISIVLPLT